MANSIVQELTAARADIALLREEQKSTTEALDVIRVALGIEKPVAEEPADDAADDAPADVEPKTEQDKPKGKGK